MRRQVEQSRARYPDAVGLLDRGGVQVFWEAYCSGEPVRFNLALRAFVAELA